MCNNNIVCKVRIFKEVTQPFKVSSRLQQGDTLSPGLFNLLLERNGNDERK